MEVLIMWGDSPRRCQHDARSGRENTYSDDIYIICAQELLASPMIGWDLLVCYP